MKSFYKLLYIAFVLSFVTSCSDVVDFETLAVPTRLMIGETGSMTLQEIEEHPGISIFLDDMRHQISEVKHSNQTDPVTDKGIMWEYINSTPVTTKVNDIN